MNILIPDTWLREYLDTKATPEEIQKYLSLCGPSVERIETIEGELVYDIEVTTNRVDMMSVVGIAREAAAILPMFGMAAKLVKRKPSNVNRNTKTDNLKRLDIKIVNDPELCHRIMAVKLENVKIGPSPEWMQKRLLQVGQRPLNNIIDITNYLMWELGHPVHAFDYDRLTSKKIVVREAKRSEKLITLDNKTHTLCGGEVIFDDGTGIIIDLPGIMGTENTVVADRTTNVLLFFDSVKQEKVRYASMGLAIRSQAAVLNEKGVDPNLMDHTMQCGIELFKKLTKATVESKIFDTFPEKKQPKSITASWEKINIYLNSQVDRTHAVDALKRLGFIDVSSTKTLLMATPPTWREKDIRIDVDLIEEIARIWGYQKFNSLLPTGALPQTDPHQGLNLEYRAKCAAKSVGYTEINTVPLVCEKEAMLVKPLKEHVHLLNPLGKEWEYLRTSLSSGLFSALRENSQCERANLFEMGLTFAPQSAGKLPVERIMLGLATVEPDYRVFRGHIEAILNELHIACDVEKNGTIVSGKQAIGIVRRPSPREIEYHKLSQLVWLAELDMDLIKTLAKDAVSVVPIPKYQPIVEQMTLAVSSDIPMGDILQTIKKSSNLDIKLVDISIWGSTPTISLEFNSDKKQLTQEEVNEEKIKILKELEKISVRLKQ